MQDTHPQDELDYQELIEKVSRIDKEAAEYMQTEMREIEGFVACSDLWEVVVWEKTLQDHVFWYNIAVQL